MSSPTNRDDHLLDLLSSRATEGLDPQEQSELDRLLADTGMVDERQRFEISAAAMDLASMHSDTNVDLPPGLRDKVLMGAGQFFSQAHDEVPADSGQVESVTVDSTEADSVSTQKDVQLGSPSTISPPMKVSSDSQFRAREALGWLVAAACLVFGIWIWNTKPIESPSLSPSISMKDVQEAKDHVSADWMGVHNQSVEGEVIWSDSLQSGYMVFDNLPVNDPTIEQYQLWIFDTDVAQQVPTDGGVFDIVEEEGTSKVFFKPTYPVKKGVQFAVTIEIPGGVQQSDRSRLPVIATIAPEDLKSPGDEKADPNESAPPL